MERQVNFDRLMSRFKTLTEMAERDGKRRRSEYCKGIQSGIDMCVGVLVDEWKKANDIDREEFVMFYSFKVALGDILFYIGDGQVDQYEFFCLTFNFMGDKTYMAENKSSPSIMMDFKEEDFGKTVFLTEGAAERALKGAEGGDV